MKSTAQLTAEFEAKNGKVKTQKIQVRSKDELKPDSLLGRDLRNSRQATALRRAKK